jgi:hypothetical protein
MLLSSAHSTRIRDAMITSGGHSRSGTTSYSECVTHRGQSIQGTVTSIFLMRPHTTCRLCVRELHVSMDALDT